MSTKPGPFSARTLPNLKTTILSYSLTIFTAFTTKIRIITTKITTAIREGNSRLSEKIFEVSLFLPPDYQCNSLYINDCNQFSLLYLIIAESSPQLFFYKHNTPSSCWYLLLDDPVFPDVRTQVMVPLCYPVDSGCGNPNSYKYADYN